MNNIKINEEVNIKLIILLVISTLVAILLALVPCPKITKTTEADEDLVDGVSNSKFSLYSMLANSNISKNETRQGIQELLNQPVGNLVLHGSQGNTINLENLKGQAYVIELFATWCPDCLSSMVQVDKLLNTKSIPFFTLAILSSNEQINDFIIDNKYEYNVYTVNDENLSLLKVKAVPTYFFVNKEGTIKYIHVGDFEVDSFLEIFNYVEKN